MEVLTKDDLEIILSSLHPKLSKDLVIKMVDFNMKLVENCSSMFRGGPWEWNLRDISHWAETIEDNDPGTFVSTIYADRMRNDKDREKVMV
jgi:midasin (ATPase involved in ribosome maturation)